MPNCKSAEKRLRQSIKRKARNKAVKSGVKTQIKKVLGAAESGDIAVAEDQFKIAAKGLDRASARKIIHRNAAARQKSRLQRAIKKAKAENAA